MVNTNPPRCPICNSLMEIKLGKYGYFWGCKNFRTKSKCRGTVDIPKKAFELEYIDYDSFINHSPTEYLLELIDREPLSSYVKRLKLVLSEDGITKGTIKHSCIEGIISGVFDYLHRKDMCFEMSKLAYWFYKLDGDLPCKIDYWGTANPDKTHAKRKIG